MSKINCLTRLNRDNRITGGLKGCLKLLDPGLGFIILTVDLFGREVNPDLSALLSAFQARLRYRQRRG